MFRVLSSDLLQYQQSGRLGDVSEAQARESTAA